MGNWKEGRQVAVHSVSLQCILAFLGVGGLSRQGRCWTSWQEDPSYPGGQWHTSGRTQRPPF